MLAFNARKMSKKSLDFLSGCWDTGGHEITEVFWEELPESGWIFAVFGYGGGKSGDMGWRGG